MSLSIRPQVGLGVNQLFVKVPEQVIALRAPLTNDHYLPGTIWIEPSSAATGLPVNGVWINTSNKGGISTWVLISQGGAGTFTSLTVNPGPVSLVTVGNGAVTIGNAANTALVQLVSGPGGVSIIGNGHAINIGADAATNVVTVGSRTNTSATNIYGGTVGILLATSVTGNISIGDGPMTGFIALGVSTTGQIINIGTGAAGANHINIGGTGANVVAIANTQTAGSYSVGAAMTTGTISIGGTGLQVGNFSLAPGTGAQLVTLANGAGIKTISIGNGTSGNTISIGNGANTVAQNVLIASGASAANSTVSILTGVASAGTQTLNVLTGAASTAGAVNIATGTAAHIVQIGSVTGAASTTIFAGTGGLVLAPTAGNASLAPATATVASPTATVTLNSRVGRVIWTGFVTAAAGFQALTVVNATVAVTSGLFVSLTHLNASGNGADLLIWDITQAAGSFVVTYQNNSAAALGAGDNVILTWWSIS